MVFKKIDKGYLIEKGLGAIRDQSAPIEILKSIKFEEGYYIYFLFGSDGSILYVGQTKNPKQRLKAHVNSRRFVIDRFIVEPCYIWDTSWVEARFIALFKPIFNIEGNPDHKEELRRKRQLAAAKGRESPRPKRYMLAIRPSLHNQS